jgi:ABC-type glycerol-3-phosphate transport system substrate-binding protein
MNHRALTRRGLLQISVATVGSLSAILATACGAPPTPTPPPQAAAPAAPTQPPAQAATVPTATTAPAAAAKPATTSVPAAAAKPAVGGKKVANVWFNQATQMDSFKANIVDHFHKSQTETQLNAILVPNEDMSTKLTAAIAGGDAPDVVRIGGPALNATFYLKGATMAIDTFDPKIHTYDYVPAIKRAITWKEKVWAMPVNSGSQVLIYNAELYRRAGLDPDKAPTTNEAMIDAATKIRKLGDNFWGQEFSTRPNANTSNLFHGTQFGFGAKEVSGDGRKVLFDEPDHLELFEWYKKNVIDSGIMPIKLMDETSMTNDFATKNLGQYLAYPSRLENAIQALGEQDARTGVLPAGPKGSISPIGFGTLIIPSKAKNPEAGWSFVNFICNDAENNSVWCTAFGQLPPRLSFRESKVFGDYVKRRPQLTPFLDGQRTARVPYFGPAVNQIWTAYAKAVEAVSFGAKAPADALKDAQAEAQAALDKELASGAEPLITN